MLHLQKSLLAFTVIIILSAFYVKTAFICAFNKEGIYPPLKPEHLCIFPTYLKIAVLASAKLKPS